MVILIVEDEFLIGWALKLVLAVAGHHAIGPAASADEAMRLAKAERPELAFVDINIAGDRDGVTLARVLTEELGTSCIFLTAQADRARAASDTALGVIDKPYDPREVVQAVEVAHSIRSGAALPAIPERLELFHRPPATIQYQRRWTILKVIWTGLSGLAAAGRKPRRGRAQMSTSGERYQRGKGGQKKKGGHADG